MTHPRDMGAAEVTAFLTMLANERRASASTHNQALSALLFLYRQVLGIQLPWLNDIGRPTTPKRIPSVLSVDEVRALLAALPVDLRLLGELLYGTGMRLMEGLRLRVKDIDFDQQVIVVREAKGNKDRVVMLPRTLVLPLRQQLRVARAMWERDRQLQVPGAEHHTRSNTSTPPWASGGGGSGCFLRPRYPLTLAAGSSGAIPCTKTGYNAD